MGHFPSTPHPETRTTPRFSLAVCWSGFQVETLVTRPWVCSSRPQQPSAQPCSGGTQSQLGGTFTVPIRGCPPEDGQQAYPQSLSRCLLSTCLLSWFTRQGCWSVWQTILLQYVSLDSASSRKPSLPDPPPPLLSPTWGTLLLLDIVILAPSFTAGSLGWQGPEPDRDINRQTDLNLLEAQSLHFPSEVTHHHLPHSYCPVMY